MLRTLLQSTGGIGVELIADAPYRSNVAAAFAQMAAQHLHMGVHGAVNSDFFDKLTLELYTKGSLNSFCVDISDTTLHTIYKIENQSFCNLHGTYLSDSANNDKIIATALAMRRKCRSVGRQIYPLFRPGSRVP